MNHLPGGLDPCAPGALICAAWVGPAIPVLILFFASEPGVDVDRVIA